MSVSGLCNISPIDKVYSLVEPNEDQKDRYGTFVGTTGWVLGYDRVINTWTITHYAYRDNDLILKDASRRPFGLHNWLVKKYLCNQGKDALLELLLSNCNA